MTTPRECPCCGQPGKIKMSQSMNMNGISVPIRGWVGCPACGLYIQWAHDPAGAIAKWNRRTSVPTYDLLYEEGGASTT